MNIGIIGTGNVGGGLGKLWGKKGHRVVFSYSRDAEKLKTIAEALPNASSGTIAEAVKQSEVLLLSVRWQSVPEVLKQAGSLKGKILIDCTNPLLPDLSGLAIGHKTSAAEEIARMVPDAHVVKAFNTVFADVYHSVSRLFGSRIATMFKCGDDRDAKSVVARLINDVGFESVDAGPLSSARYLEPLAMLMIQLASGQGMGRDIALNLMRR